MARENAKIGPTLPEGLLLEGIVTTLNEDGSPHISPMGPIVDVGITQLLLRPYRTSTTYQNLKRSGEGVLHVTDDVELIARAALGALPNTPSMFPAKAVRGQVLADACRWYEFRVDSLDDSDERTEIHGTVVERGHIREFFGFNRAKHAVIEAAILATRLDWLDADDVQVEFERLAVIVEKTGGVPEHSAFDFLRTYAEEKLAGKSVETAS